MTKLSWIKLDAVHDWYYIALELQKQDCVTERLLVQILGASGKRDWGLLSLLVTEGAILNTPAQVKLLKDNQSLTGSKTAGSPFSPFWPLTAAWGKHTCSQQYSIVSIEVLTHTHTHIENKKDKLIDTHWMHTADKSVLAACIQTTGRPAPSLVHIQHCSAGVENRMIKWKPVLLVIMP